MKKILLFISLTIMLMVMGITVTVRAQSIPNPSFETWDSAVFMLPQNYPYSSNQQDFYKYQIASNVIRTNAAEHGSYAVQLTTTVSAGDTAFGYFLSTNPNNGNPGTWHGGMPYSQTPTGIRGYYKSNIGAGDSAVVIVTFSSAGSNIGAYFFKIGGVQASYTLFNFTFPYAPSGTPDSVALGFTSSDVINNVAVAGSTITIDSVSFTGVGSQPADMNGDFESWQTYTPMTPASWFYEGDDQGDGLSRTTDVWSGNYAVQLQTYYRDGGQSGSPRANSTNIGTGHYPDNCNGFCSELGGYPFTNQVDTLTLWYKYIPSGNDSAQVQVNLKNSGTSVGGNDFSLGAALTWQYAELPFSGGSTPDSAMVNFQSSIGNDTALSFVGSTLIIDDIYFKSQLNTGIKESKANYKIAICPNPMTTTATLAIDQQADLKGMQLHITDILGRTITTVAVTSHTMILQKNNLVSGVYLYEVINNSQIFKTGKLVIE